MSLKSFSTESNFLKLWAEKLVSFAVSDLQRYINAERPHESYYPIYRSNSGYTHSWDRSLGLQRHRCINTVYPWLSSQSCSSFNNFLNLLQLKSNSWRFGERTICYRSPRPYSSRDNSSGVSSTSTQFSSLSKKHGLYYNSVRTTVWECGIRCVSKASAYSQRQVVLYFMNIFVTVWSSAHSSSFLNSWSCCSASIDSNSSSMKWKTSFDYYVKNK